eukprot:TRINITY_DN6688_c1_g1_i1.p1 TRINITY_DN6688_c1_g1~~TRINITY_DN6688_c1_g1_i1.p1  ORF type:complete len:644 (+),score=167.18 TRINITY_DN6688_c1_g1_i1:118-2049(+)
MSTDQSPPPLPASPPVAEEESQQDPQPPTLSLSTSSTTTSTTTSTENVQVVITETETIEVQPEEKKEEEPEEKKEEEQVKEDNKEGDDVLALSEKTVLRLVELNREYELDSDHWTNPMNNPHIWGQLLGNDEQSFRSYYSALRIPFDRVMRKHHPSASYRRRKDEEKTVLHWGQRKLLIAEIEFLTMYGHLSSIVVYAGAAPGTHTESLAKLFPNHRFFLYDPAPFTVKDSENIETHQILFTDEVAETWRGKNVLFISDIRSADPSLMEEEEVEDNVHKDQDWQKEWCLIMQPAMASLKFRLPWSTGKTQYFRGDVFYQVWGPITTTETRLFTDCKQEAAYDNTEYESKLFHFNTVTRIALYPHTVCGVDGLDHCYDCAAEVHVLKRFLSQVGLPGRDPIPEKAPENDVEVAKLMNLFTSRIARDRTLASGNLDPGDRRQNITRRQFVEGAPAYAPHLRPGAVYSSKSIAMMEKMLGSKLNSETRLGANSSGISSPIQHDKRKGGRGLGFQGGSYSSSSSSPSSSSPYPPPVFESSALGRRPREGPSGRDGKPPRKQQYEPSAPPHGERDYRRDGDRGRYEGHGGHRDDHLPLHQGERDYRRDGDRGRYESHGGKRNDYDRQWDDRNRDPNRRDSRRDDRERK